VILASKRFEVTPAPGCTADDFTVSAGAAGVDCDHSPAIREAESLLLDSVAAGRSVKVDLTTPFTATTDTFFVACLRVDAVVDPNQPGNTPIFVPKSSGGVTGEVKMLPGGKLRCENFASGVDDAAAPLVAGTTYELEINYEDAADTLSVAVENAAGDQTATLGCSVTAGAAGGGDSDTYQLMTNLESILVYDEVRVHDATMSLPSGLCGF